MRTPIKIISNKPEFIRYKNSIGYIVHWLNDLVDYYVIELPDGYWTNVLKPNSDFIRLKEYN